ncbi:MAG: Flp family type IVb pilin [Burkholderiaceae bacterium]
MIKSFIKDEAGANAIEYSLIAAIIAVGITLFLPNVRDALNNMFTNIANCLWNNGQC